MAESNYGRGLPEGIIHYGQEYNLTTNNVYTKISERKGEWLGKEDILGLLLGEGYLNVPVQDLDAIWVTLIEPDIQQFLEMGYLEEDVVNKETNRIVE